jgi:hypothetical protein
VEWIDLVKGPLSATPMAACLGFAVHKLWAKLQEKDAEIARLNDQRVKDLIAVAARDD